MLEVKDIDYDSLPDLISNIAGGEFATELLEVDIAIAINLNSERFGNYRKHHECVSVEYIAIRFGQDIPKYLRSLDAARDLFRAFHGELENPFVYTILNDYGGLRRVRISEPLSGITVTVDGPTEESALVAATLKLAVIRHRLTLEEANEKK